jgi:transcriptional regulator with XRE-family HTH domain
MRKSKGMTQLNVAEGLHVSPQAVSKWERGESLPDIALLPDLAGMLDVSVGEMLNAGAEAVPDIQETLNRLSRFVNAELYAGILRAAREANSARDLAVPFDLLLLLSGRQKDAVAEALLLLRDYELVMEEVFPYMGPVQRRKIVRVIIERRNFPLLVDLAPFMDAHTRLETLLRAVEHGDFSSAESLFPFLTREQKDWFREMCSGIIGS